MITLIEFLLLNTSRLVQIRQPERGNEENNPGSRHKRLNQVRVGPDQHRERWCVAPWHRWWSREHHQTARTLYRQMDLRSPCAGEKDQNTVFSARSTPTRFRVNIRRVDECVDSTNHPDLRLGEQSGPGLISPTETYPGFP